MTVAVIIGGVAIVELFNIFQLVTLLPGKSRKHPHHRIFNRERGIPVLLMT